jgi:hypothetical protein
MNTNLSSRALSRVRRRPTAASYFARHPFQALLLAALLVLLAGSGRAFAAPNWPELPVPPKADTQWIGKNMRVNGAPTRVLAFQSRASREEVVEYYRAHWTGKFERPPSVKPYRQSTIVAQKIGPWFLTVKVEDGERGESHGVISVAQLIGSRFDRNPGELTLMPGAQVVSVVESDDPGKHSRQVVIITPQMPAMVNNFYQSSLANAGWHQIQATELAANRTQGGGRFVVYGRGNSEMQISIMEPRKGRGSMMLANLVTNDTGRDSP